jgi:hypothetical protein
MVQKLATMYPDRSLLQEIAMSNQQALEFDMGSNRNPNGPSRSKQMIHTLRQEFVYSEKRARDMIFQEIEAALRASGSSLMISRLTREAAARARARAQVVRYDLSNWDTAAKATMNAMLGAGVLLARDGNAIPLTIGAQAAEVANLATGYRDITEAYLLEVLIRRLGNVTARDQTALAHALFRQFDRAVAMEDMEDRVAWLLASLENRVAVTEAGAYYAIDYSGQTS